MIFMTTHCLNWLIKQGTVSENFSPKHFNLQLIVGLYDKN